MYVFANWRVPCEESHQSPVLLSGVVVCVCSFSFSSSLRFLIMPSFLLHADVVRRVCLHHCETTSACFVFPRTHLPFVFGSSDVFVLTPLPPFCRFCCSPVFHASYSPTFQTTAFGCARQISALPPLRRFVVAPRVFSTTGLSELLAALGSSV